MTSASAPEGSVPLVGPAERPPHFSVTDLAERLAGWYRLLFAPDQVVELRALDVQQGRGRPHVEAGFYDPAHWLKLASDAWQLTRQAKGVYFTLNPLQPDLLARRCGRITWANEGQLASDKDVLARRWLLIDADPVRDPLISSNDTEKAAAWQTLLAVRGWLQEQGWPEPIVSDSGNGYHLLYRVELPADDGGLVQRVLQVLATRFDTAQVKIDQKVFNPARICKLPGTLARKGDSTPLRPHRWARVLEVPGATCCPGPVPRKVTGAAEVWAFVGAAPSSYLINVVPRELLTALSRPTSTVTTLLLEPVAAASALTASSTPDQITSATAGAYTSRLQVDRWLSERGIAFRVKNQPDGRGRTVYVLKHCPFDPSHGDPDACIMQAPNGQLSAQCFHNSCGGRGWQDFKQALGAPERHHYDPPLPERSRPRRPRQRAARADTNQAGEQQPVTPPIAAADKPECASAALSSPNAPIDPGGIAGHGEADDDPHRLAAYWLQYHVKHPHRPRTAYYREQWWTWSETRGIWLATPDSEMRAWLAASCKEHMERFYVPRVNDHGEVQPPPKVTTGLVGNTLQALTGKTLVPTHTSMPVWLDDRGRHRDYLVVANGLLDVRAFLAGQVDVLQPFTPHWFSPIGLPHAFDVEATCPRWEAFLERNLDGASGPKASLLQEWCGYLLLPTVAQQRFLLMIGEGANGKSVICAMLRALLGEDNTCTVPLELFGERFHLAETVGKLANIIPEVGELDRIAEGTLKAFTAGDAMVFERKFKTPFTTTPTARLVLSTNNVPAFSDKSDGLWRRMLLLPLLVQIPEQERVAGMDTVGWWQQAGELPGILNWALLGLHRLQERGRFAPPEECRQAAESMRSDTNPARKYLLEHWQTGSGEIATAELYREYTEWCRANGHHALAEGNFGKEVLRTFRQVRKERKGTATRYMAYCGLLNRAD